MRVAYLKPRTVRTHAPLTMADVQGRHGYTLCQATASSPISATTTREGRSWVGLPHRSKNASRTHRRTTRKHNASGSINEHWETMLWVTYLAPQPRSNKLLNDVPHYKTFRVVWSYGRRQETVVRGKNNVLSVFDETPTNSVEIDIDE